MPLINRVSRLFKADINAVLDRIEEPEQLLRQAMRDMEDELAESERRIAACGCEQESLQRRRKELSVLALDLEQQLDLCFDSGQEQLARSTIRRQLETARATRHLDRRIETNEEFLERERRQLEENRATLEGLRQKAELIVSHATGVKDCFDRANLDQLTRESSVSDEDVEIAWLREKAAREGNRDASRSAS